MIRQGKSSSEIVPFVELKEKLHRMCCTTCVRQGQSVRQGQRRPECQEKARVSGTVFSFRFFRKRRTGWRGRSKPMERRNNNPLYGDPPMKRRAMGSTSANFKLPTGMVENL